MAAFINAYIWINIFELVVHVVLLVAVSPAWDASVGHSLGVGTLAFHGLIICDDSYLDTSFVGIQNFVGEIVVGEGEDTQVDGPLSHLNILLHLLDISHIWEEEGILVLGLWLIKGGLKLSDHLSETDQNFFVVIALHLIFGDGEKMVHSGLDMLSLVLAPHFREGSAEVPEVRLGVLEVFIALVNPGNLLVSIFNLEWLWFGTFHRFMFG